MIVVIMAMANDAYKGLTPSRALIKGPMTNVPLAIVEAMAFTVPRLCGGARSSDSRNVKLPHPERHETKRMTATYVTMSLESLKKINKMWLMHRPTNTILCTTISGRHFKIAPKIRTATAVIRPKMMALTNRFPLS